LFSIETQDIKIRNRLGLFVLFVVLVVAERGGDVKDMFRFSCCKLYQIYSLCGRFRNLLSCKQLRQELALLLTQNMLIHLINFM